MNCREEIAARRALITREGAVTVHCVILLVWYLGTVVPMPGTDLPEPYIPCYVNFQSENLHFQKITLLLAIARMTNLQRPQPLPHYKFTLHFAKLSYIEFDNSGTRAPNVILMQAFYIRSDFLVVKIWHCPQRRSEQELHRFILAMDQSLTFFMLELKVT